MAKNTIDGLVRTDPQLRNTIDLLANQRDEPDGAQAQVTSLAEEYLAGMQASLNPFALLASRLWAWRTVNLSFAGIETTGLEKAMPAIEQGKAIIVPTHYTYFDLAMIGAVLFGRSDLYVVGGDNVTKLPGKSAISKAKAGFVRWTFRNSGLIEQNRQIKEESEALKARVLLAYAKTLIEGGNNILIFAGTGRYKSGTLQPYSTILNRVFIPDGSVIIPVAATYTVVPEDDAFAHMTDQARASVFTALEKQRWKRPYGRIFVNFGSPIPLQDYRTKSNGRVPTTTIARLENEVTEALKRLMTLTPVNLLAAAAALSNYGEREFTISEACGPAQEILRAARGAGVNTSRKLEPTSVWLDFAETLASGARKLSERGALEEKGAFYSVKDPELLRYYANHIIPTLQSFKIL